MTVMCLPQRPALDSLTRLAYNMLLKSVFVYLSVISLPFTQSQQGVRRKHGKRQAIIGLRQKPSRHTPARSCGYYISCLFN